MCRRYLPPGALRHPREHKMYGRALIFTPCAACLSTGPGPMSPWTPPAMVTRAFPERVSLELPETPCKFPYTWIADPKSIKSPGFRVTADWVSCPPKGRLKTSLTSSPLYRTGVNRQGWMLQLLYVIPGHGGRKPVMPTACLIWSSIFECYMVFLSRYCFVKKCFRQQGRKLADDGSFEKPDFRSHEATTV